MWCFGYAAGERSAGHDYVFFLSGVALHHSTVAWWRGVFLELAGVTANIHSLYTGHGHGMGYIMIPSSGWERKGWRHDGTWEGGTQHLEARLEFTDLFVYQEALDQDYQNKSSSHDRQ